MDCSNGCGILQAIGQIMSKIYTPAVQAIDKWGNLDESPQGVMQKRDFLKTLSSFTHFVDGMGNSFFSSSMGFSINKVALIYSI